MSETLEYKVRLTGSDAAKADIQEVSSTATRAQTQATAAARQAEQAQRRQSMSFNDLKQAAETGVRVLDRMITSVQSLNQQYGFLDRDGARAVRQIGELTHRLSEQGLAAGAATTTIEMLVEAWASAGWIERRTEATHQQAQGLASLRAEAERLLRAEREQEEAAGSVGAAQVELRARTMRLEQTMRELGRAEHDTTMSEQARARAMDNLSVRTARYAADVVTATAALAALEEEEEQQRMLQDDIATASAIAERARAAAQRAREDSRRREDSEAQFFAEAEAARDAASAERHAERMETLRQGYEVAQQLRDAELERIRAHDEKLVEDARALREKLAEADARQREEAEAAMAAARGSFDQMATSISGTFTGAISGAVDAWLSGAKSFEEAAADMVKGVLKALVSESIVQAIVETARGIAAVASYRYDAAALHFAAAGTWAAVGVAAGVVGGAIGAFGGASAGGASGGGASASQPSSAAPAPAPAAGITINLYAPNAIMTEAERAQLIAGSLREGRRQLGVQAVRT